MAVARDLATIGEGDRHYQAYLWNPTPVLAARPTVAFAAGIAAELIGFDAALKLHVNSLSRAGDLKPPDRVAEDLWRVDIRHYKWDRAVWEKMAQRNVYFNERVTTTVDKPERKVRSKKTGKVFVKKASKEKVVVDGPASWLPTEPIAFVIEQTGSRTPIVHGAWFIANTSRQLSLRNKEEGFGYYEWLGIGSRADYFRLADVRLKASRDREKDIREAVSVSGVSKQNRQIEYNPTINGALFTTLDVDDETGTGNAVENLRRGDYVHKAEEHYLPLPNGLPAYLLCDDKGVRQAQAPQFVPRKGDIHAGFSCIECHAANVLQPVDGWTRKNFRVDKLALNVPAYFLSESPEKRFAVYEELRRQYLKLNFDNELNTQRELYRRKFREVSGVEPEALVRQYVRVVKDYEESVSLTRAAREWGCTAEEVEKAFTWYSSPEGTGGINNGLGALVKGEPLPRLHFEDLYAEGQRIMLAYRTKGKTQP